MGDHNKALYSILKPQVLQRHLWMSKLGRLGEAVALHVAVQIFLTWTLVLNPEL